MIKLTILGSGAATPTLNRGVTAQYLNFNERRILIDCGEATQLQFRKFKVKFQRIQYIFISHLHGDHYLGLPGLLASMHLLGREKELHIFAPPELEQILKQQFELTYVKLNFQLIFHHLEQSDKGLIFEDDNMEVLAFPLKHRIPCFGFLFQEKLKERSIIPEMIKAHDLTIPEILLLKRGDDIERNGKVLQNENLTKAPPKPLSYAFCTDTRKLKHLPMWINGVSLLYHEATFLEKDKDRAKKTFHTTALQAAEIASEAKVGKLILGHISARYKSENLIEAEAKTVFPKTAAVTDGDEFLIS